MDSRLLNVFHDDPFDGNYVKYDTDTQFWSSGSETLGLQLTETLHGILPIAPTEVGSTNIYSGSLLKDGDYSLESKHDSNTNSLIYGDYDDATPLGVVNKRQLSSQQAIEIVSVDPNEDYDSEFLESTDDEDDEEGNGDYGDTAGIMAYDEVRSCSRSTFRSRTDSSSIGDYESHSSDYDDETDAEDAMNFVHMENGNRLQATNVVDDFALHSDANELKKTMEDVDAFGIQLDASTFDLAAFITQDDQVFESNGSQTLVVPAPAPRVDLGKVVVPTMTSASDSDSDVIVDVETVENDDIDDGFWDPKQAKDIEYTDNVKGDPSWSPNKQKSEKKEAKPVEPNFKSNFTVIPNKRQTNFLKRKFGLGRGKNISMHRNPAKALPKPDLKCKSQQTNNNNNNNVEEKSKNSIIQVRIPPAEKKIENLMVKEEKKLATPTPEKKIESLPIKQEVAHVKIKLEKGCPAQKQMPAVAIKVEKTNGTSQTQPITNGKCMKLLKHDTVSIKVEPVDELYPEVLAAEVEVVSDEQQPQLLPQKRKLNLEEYKKRRENPSAFPPSSKNVQTVDIAKMRKTEASVQTAPIAIKPQVTKPPQTPAVTSIVKSLKESQGAKRFVDPITEAKNKVLRMQELKKAQQIKIIDSTVSSKVGRVTKLLPLKDIVKNSYKSNNGDDGGGHAMTNPDYEEIIIVSTGCNTDITIPPGGYSTVPAKVGKNASRSLLKSSVLLANISNSFEKVRSDETVKISSNSLLVSIQDVVVKKSAPLPTEPIKAPQGNSSMSEHGEDKIIMHLRKDRIRKRKFSQSIQTDLLPEFPALPPPPAEHLSCDSSQSRSRKGRRRQYRSRQHSYSSDEEPREYRDRSRSSSRSVGKRSRHHRSSVSSSSSESDDYPKRGRRYSASSSQSRDRSRSFSPGRRSRSKSFDRVYRNSRSRSKSSSRSRSRSTRCGDASRHVDRNVSAPAVEERRIVYVGRIEQDTTKEMLRRKFVAYGPIKQITIHYKDTGMKYGFVTYEKSEDAFRVIDSGQKDETINMYDISFGGRRAFCRASYADLDNAGINTYQSYVVPRPVAPPKEEDSFEALLLKVKAKLNATKSSSTNSKI